MCVPVFPLYLNRLCKCVNTSIYRVNPFIYVYIYMYICICIYIYICVCVYIYRRKGSPHMARRPSEKRISTSPLRPAKEDMHMSACTYMYICT